MGGRFIIHNNHYPSIHSLPTILLSSGNFFMKILALFKIMLYICRMNVSMFLVYLGILIVRVLMIVPSLLLFPIAFLFRNKAYRYTEENGLIGFHPLQWCSWFFTKYCDRGDWYTGPFWYMNKLKLKYFNEFHGANNDDPIVRTFKQRIIYFYIAYRWSAVRNYMWNISRELFEEGGIWSGLEIKSIKIIRHSLKIEGNKKSVIVTPQLKYTDFEGSYSANKGDYVLYPGNSSGFSNQVCTLEGVHCGVFRTVKRNRKRFNYRYVSLKRFGSILVCIETFQGWSYYAGWPEFRFKLKMNRMDEKALGDYLEYQARLNLINSK